MTAAAEIVGVIALLETFDLEALRLLWQQRFGSRPRLRSPELLRLLLAWRLQAAALGGLDPETARRLRLRGRVQAEGLELGVGARLRRTWRGTAVEVVVEEDGFRWEDRLYPSLSAAATAIAGSRWNGPKFFGLRRPAP
jgi:Protein of unknown function (DUF2924)